MNIDDIIENAQLKGRVIGLEAQVETLTAEVRCLEAVIRAHERIDCQAVANLKAEVARLTELNSSLDRRYDAACGSINGSTNYIGQLEEDIERLTKAGDAMGKNLTLIGWNICVDAWNAAKEGKQS